MQSQFQEIEKLVEQRIASMQRTKELERALVDQLYYLPKEVIMAIGYGIVKPTFPVPMKVIREIRCDILNQEK